MISKQNVKIIQDGQVYTYGFWDTNLYKMKFRPVWPTQAYTAQKMSLKLLHEIMGHVSIYTLRKMIKDNVVTDIEFNDKTSFFCEACQYDKQTRRPFHSVISKNVNAGEVTHMDVCDRRRSGTEWSQIFHSSEG